MNLQCKQQRYTKCQRTYHEKPIQYSTIQSTTLSLQAMSCLYSEQKWRFSTMINSCNSKYHQFFVVKIRELKHKLWLKQSKFNTFWIWDLHILSQIQSRNEILQHELKGGKSKAIKSMALFPLPNMPKIIFFFFKKRQNLELKKIGKTYWDQEP